MTSGIDVGASTSLMPFEAEKTSAAAEAFFSRLDPHQLSLLLAHLMERSAPFCCDRPVLHVVFDLLPYCNLECLGCGVSATHRTGLPTSSDMPLKTQDVLLVLEAIKAEAERRKVSVRLDMGGGEPLLRDDILAILRHANSLFGKQAVGIDTNATLPHAKEILTELVPYLSYLGVSINGLPEYHNWWTNVKNCDSFSCARSVLEALCSSEEAASIVEATSVVTSRNIDDLPVLLTQLFEIGVKNYSVHRPMLSGRMKRFGRLVPSATQYLELLVALLEVSEKTGQRAHVHHTLERMYTALLLHVLKKEGCRIGPDDEGLKQAFITTFTSNPQRQNEDITIGISPKGNIIGGAWHTDRCPILETSILDDSFCLSDQIDEIVRQKSLSPRASCDTGRCQCRVLDGLDSCCRDDACPLTSPAWAI